MRTTDNIKPLPTTRIEEFNAWLDWVHTKLLFKHPRARRIFVYDRPKKDRVMGAYYDCEPGEFE